MKKRKLGAALEVSAVGYGCMGLNYHRGPAKDRNEMIAVIHAAIDLGVTMFDTAEVYGPYINEELVGDALIGRRDKVCLATKFGFDIPSGRLDRMDSRPETVVKAVDGSLKRLKTDYIDLLYQHRVDPNVPIEEVAGTVARLVESGKVRHWGMSEAGADTIRKAHSVLPLAAVENEYSMWFRNAEKTIFPTLEELGIGIVAYSPLGRGYLTGKIDKNATFAENDNRADLPRFTKDAMEANRVIIDYIEQLAAEKQATTSQIAIAWILAQRPNIVPIPGTTKPARIAENIAAAEITFTPQEMAAINERLAAIPIVGDRYPGALAGATGK